MLTMQCTTVSTAEVRRWEGGKGLGRRDRNE